MTAALALSLLAACSREAPAPAPSAIPAVYVDADGSNPTAVRDTLRNRYPHIRFEDGIVSINDRCPVRKAGLNLRLPALFVNGRPVGFC
jgi:hypothetical protein